MTTRQVTAPLFGMLSSGSGRWSVNVWRCHICAHLVAIWNMCTHVRTYGTWSCVDMCALVSTYTALVFKLSIMSHLSVVLIIDMDGLRSFCVKNFLFSSPSPESLSPTCLPTLFTLGVPATCKDPMPVDQLNHIIQTFYSWFKTNEQSNVAYKGRHIKRV